MGKEISEIEREAMDQNNIERVITELEKAHEKGELVLEPNVGIGYLLRKSLNRRLLELLQERPLTDLGAGNYAFLVLDLGRIANSPEINAVDICGSSFEKINWETYYSGYDMGNAKLVRGDILRFVSKLPENYGNFMINGIDSNILNREGYISYLLAHLKRCTPEEGVVFGINTFFLPRLEKFNFKDITRGVFDHEYEESLPAIYQKIKNLK